MTTLSSRTQLENKPADWSFTNQVAPWKEKKTTMKIIKYITIAFTYPIALLMDLIKKIVNGVTNYIQPKKIIVEKKSLGNSSIMKIKDLENNFFYSKLLDYVILAFFLFCWYNLNNLHVMIKEINSQLKSTTNFINVSS